MNTAKNELISSIIYSPHVENNFRSFTTPLANGTLFSIRSLDIRTDLPVIHTWVNMPYAIPFWRMNISPEELEKSCRSAMELPFAHTFVGCLYGQPYCQVDIYDPSCDTIGEYYPVEKGDLGMHLLIGPGKKPVRHFSLQIVLPFLGFLFQSAVLVQTTWICVILPGAMPKFCRILKPMVLIQIRILQQAMILL